MSLLKQYLDLKHRMYFEDVIGDAVSGAILNELGQREVQQKWIYVAHTDPLKFAVSFLAILDRGGIPVCLPSAKNIQLDSWAFIEGVWVSSGPPREFLGLNNRACYAVPTSGTTGTPSLCEFYLEKAFLNAKAHAQGFGIYNQLEIIQTLPVHHSYGIVAYILTPLVTGCAVHFCPSMVGVRSLKKDKSPHDSIIHLSPSQARFLIRDSVSVPQIKKVSVGGGTITLDELDKLQGVFLNSEIFVSYGLTEAGPRVTAGLFARSMKQEMNLDGSVNWIGSPISNVNVKLIDPAPGEWQSGRLCVQSPYIKMNTQSEEMDGDWLVTRDRVRIQDNQIFFLSREDDLLKYGGMTIYPKEIENSVRNWPGVRDVIILKEADPMYGERPLLIIEGDIELKTVQELLVRDVVLYTAFSEIFIQGEFPRQSLDKIDRKKLLQSIRGARK
ncbi:MAG: acyl--CoA ligase [Bdellovibrionales bacterium]|nr:acyl--CoA ligase [Bdellovibrionales bacterium]